MGTERAFRVRALASLGATAGMILLPTLYLLLEAFGPSARVAFLSYIPVEGVAVVFGSGLLGVALGAGAYRWLRPEGPAYSEVRLAVGCVLGGAAAIVASVAIALFAGPKWGSAGGWLAVAAVAGASIGGAWSGGVLLYKSLDAPAGPRRVPRIRLAGLACLLAWLIVPHLRAFPAGGTAAEREAWARGRVREYAGLARIVGRVPVVAADVGRIVAIAPTSTDRHVSAVGMNGDELNFTLDVIGAKGAGVFKVDCAISDGVLFEWRSGRWTFAGKVTPVDPPGSDQPSP